MRGYSIDEHTHRFALWTAARAVQRSFTTTENVKFAIDNSGLQNFVESSACESETQFDEFHKLCANKIMLAFKVKNIDEVSYGRAAKIIGIYLKTAIVIRSGGLDDRCSFIHPPVDRILLTKLSEFGELNGLKNKNWTQLSKDGYWEIVDIIRKSKFPFDWTLEE
ncbi:MAG: hypothetical protein LH619_07570 [Chitinophagaceae bacterium]|nr:hypothetical protein [Chitinophagaceae bacterium]